LIDGLREVCRFDITSAIDAKAREASDFIPADPAWTPHTIALKVSRMVAMDKEILCIT
jgi:hypothetical protein